jgi:hypothetical protein
MACRPHIVIRIGNCRFLVGRNCSRDACHRMEWCQRIPFAFKVCSGSTPAVREQARMSPQGGKPSCAGGPSMELMRQTGHRAQFNFWSAAPSNQHELAPPHSITSSAPARSESGIVRPIALAVLRLMTRRKRVGCSSGRSAGLAPLRIRSTRYAPRLALSAASGP